MFGSKKIGIIGLGKMGYRIAERLLEKRYEITATDLNPEAIRNIEEKGAVGVNSLEELAKNLQNPRTLLISIPAGKEIDKILENLTPYLSEKDIIIDSGNSFYKESQCRAKTLKKKGIYFLDLGVSGGIDGARNGACLMIGGEKEAFKTIEHVFKDLSKNGSYKYVGKSGAGHLVKGFHNFIEYGYLQSLAEGLSCLYTLSEKEKIGLNLQDICEIWNKGSIIESRLVKDAETALKNHNFKGISGSVFGQSQKEMIELVKIAKNINVEVPSCKAALNARISSQKKPTLAGKITNAIRNIFGGHKEWEKQ